MSEHDATPSDVLTTSPAAGRATLVCPRVPTLTTQTWVAKRYIRQQAALHVVNYADTVPLFKRTNLAATPYSRCENRPYFRTTYGACVFYQVRPVFAGLSLSNPVVDEAASHIWHVQRTFPDHWGAYYSNLMGKPLHRYYWAGPGKNPNRTVACANFVKRNSSDSCDEYPFATTEEGAYFVGRARSSVWHINVNDNKNAGTSYSIFLQFERVMNGEAFWVAIRN